MLRVAGVGPGNPKYLTMDVYQRIKEAKYILAFGRIAKTLEDIRDDIAEVKRVDEVIEFLEDKNDVLLLASGDPNFFGIVDFLKRKGVRVDEILPGLSSFQYLMAKLEKPWQGARFISLHGRDDSLEDVVDQALTVVLTDKENTASYISRRLKELGMKGKIYIGFNLSYEDELIKKISIGEEVENLSPLAVVVIENEMD